MRIANDIRETASVNSSLSRRPSFEPVRSAPPSGLATRRSIFPLRQPFASTTIAEERPQSVMSDASTLRPLSPQVTPILRKRHLPSLALSLLPGAPARATPDSTNAAGSANSLASPSLHLRQHSSPQARTLATSASGYFGSPSHPSGEGNGSSPGSRSLASDGSGGIIRRVSLSDLKIPPRISNAQVKIGQDLQRVKEFKEGVEGRSAPAARA